ncbi:MAG TPA: DUF2090 domain-containing protein [Capillimicrobium sp.]|jgi:myo-inositol catabolism protein IolC
MHFLAFDHREAFLELFGGDRERVADAKDLVYEAACATPGVHGVLVDERTGARTARRVRADGKLALAMPVERSGQQVFTFDFEDWRAHIDAFDPDVCKVLVRYRADGDAAANAVQRERLKELADALAPTRRAFLFELLVPGASVDERPELARRAMAECQEAGIEVDIWKLEGTPSLEAAAMLVQQARATGREDVVCQVLGAGADAATVREWLAAAGATDGYAGFAIGRSIWQEPLEAWRDGAADRDETARRIAERCGGFITAFEASRQATP